MNFEKLQTFIGERWSSKKRASVITTDIDAGYMNIRIIAFLNSDGNIDRILEQTEPKTANKFQRPFEGVTPKVIWEQS